ncbi:MAG: DNA polymerase III subunit delta' [Proteobacteria bacterium]|nr:DNA polymerase III subunit delta' [Pseudomonadota bacterium]
MNDIAPEPRETFGLTGHAAAESALRTAWQSGRMPHAWLLGGPRGIGKATLAYRFTRAVLASGRTGLFAGTPEWEVPPGHEVFRWIANEAHPDLHVVAPSVDSRTGKLREGIVVDDARRIADFFSRTAADGGWRVAIVDAADELNVAAANALLKAVEEPPDRGLVLIVCHRPGIVLPTIRSRCRVLPMGRLSDAEVAAVLSRQWPELEPAVAAGLVVMAEGSPGRAIDLGESDGFGLYADLVAMLGRLPEHDTALMHRFADRIARRDAARAFRTLADLPAWWVARLVRWGAAQPPASEAAPGEINTFERLLPRLSLAQWTAVWETLSRDAARAQSRNLDRKQAALLLLTTLAEAAGAA